MRVINSDADIEEGAFYLRKRFPEFGHVFDTCDPIDLRRRPPGFATLFHAIVGQQVSVASAKAIWARVEDAGFDIRGAVSSATPEQLAGVGLSRPKIRYAHALAHSDLDFAALETLEDAAVIKSLTNITGIGSWTAEVYALVALGRADVFPHADLALQESGKLLFGWDQRPNEKQMKHLAAVWSPWRAVAARLLWAYYRDQKNREGIR